MRNDNAFLGEYTKTKIYFSPVTSTWTSDKQVNSLNAREKNVTEL